MDRQLLALEGDHHAGHELGLLCPGAFVVRTDEDGAPYDHPLPQNAWQRRTWAMREGHLACVEALADGLPVDWCFGGDLTDGVRHHEGQMDVTGPEQLDLEERNVADTVAAANRVRFVSGTSAHARIGRNLASAKLASRFPNARAMRHARFRVQGRWVDVAHHGPSKGLRWWLEGNNARYYLRDRVLRDANTLGVEPAAAYVRFHHHVGLHEVLSVDVGGRPHLARLVVVPGYCGMTQYAQKVTQSVPYVVNGMAVLEFVAGELVKVHELNDATDLRIEELL